MSPAGERRGPSGAAIVPWAVLAIGTTVLVAAAAFALTYRGAGSATAGPAGPPPAVTPPAVAPSASSASTSCSPQGAVVHVAAHNTSFDAVCLAAPARKPFTIVFDNQDPGITHDVAIFTDPSASHALFTGALVTGPKTVTYNVGALPAGTYFFHCNVHPTVMHGTFVVG